MGKRHGSSRRGGGGGGSGSAAHDDERYHDNALYEALLSDEEAAEAVVDVAAYDGGVESADDRLQPRGGGELLLSPPANQWASPEAAASTPHVAISISNEREEPMHASLARSLPELSPELLYRAHLAGNNNAPESELRRSH